MLSTTDDLRIRELKELSTPEQVMREVPRTLTATRVVMAAPDRSAGRLLYDKAVAGGAQALGRDSGAIAAGRLADLIALDAGEGLSIPAWPDMPLDDWVFTGSRRVVDLWSAGRHAVRSGRHAARSAIQDRYRATLANLAEKL